ncbi:hypothetical protein RJT34_12910 [Clitoria ternatea]|uniref:Bromo domain-containing protein n=1 Tax=Clitoria ternatea TaxID=43366 RepID=A0AAN9PKZ2_CLITE
MCIGTKRKREKIQDEIEHRERRRSSRIIALEEKKQQEKERRLVLALERENNSVNHDNKDKEKGKAITTVEDDLTGSNDNEKRSATMKGDNSAEEIQLISSFKVENYYEIVKQPMDFGTIRAKIHKGTYTNFEEFKRDVHLICSNAISVNPATSKYHKVAKDIRRYARWIFEALSTDSGCFNIDFSFNKGRMGRKPQNEQLRTTRLARASPKPIGRNNVAHVTIPELENRDMYWPSSTPLVTMFLNAKEPNIQLNNDPSQYKHSLLRYVKDLGPTTQRVAARKLEAFKSQQLFHGDTSTQNILKNVTSTQFTPQDTPWTPTEPNSFSAQTLPLALPYFNRPFTIPSSTAQENRNMDPINTGGVNIRDHAHKGKRIYTNDQWTYDPAILSNTFFNNEKVGRSIGFESTNAKGTMQIGSPSKDKMVSLIKNVSSFIGSPQENANQNYKLQLGVNKIGNTGQWNTSAATPNMIATESSNIFFTHVHPTYVIPRPQPTPLSTVLLENKNSLSRLSSIPNLNSKHMPNTTLPKLSLTSQPWTNDSISYMPSNNLTMLSLMHQPRSSDTINLSELPLMSQPKPKDSMFNMPSNNMSNLSLMHQPLLANSISGMNLSRVSPLCQSIQEGSIPSNLYQEGDFHAIMGSSYLNNRNNLMQVISQLSQSGPVPLQEPMSSSTPQIHIGGLMSYYEGGGAHMGQPKKTNDQQPNLALQL